MCLFVLQTSKIHEMTAVADTHTEYNQLPHVHVHSSPADAHCYVMQCYHHTPKSLSQTGGLYYFSILPMLSIAYGQRSNNFIS